MRHWSSRRRTCSRERRCTIFCADSRSLTSSPPRGTRDARREGLDHLQVVASGGESLAPETVRAWRTGRRMLDAYGPTESTVVALLADIGDEILLGEPIPGTGVLVLDTALHPVPLGGVGEMYLTGDGLARGYWTPRGRRRRGSWPRRTEPDGCTERATGFGWASTDGFASWAASTANSRFAVHAWSRRWSSRHCCRTARSGGRR
ncbi:AMP-binding protein [Rhodococcus hoagii]|nr:AMP-binding protein [Prescottella equi]NKZ88275.1 AMP-binding protein [Prescottella equi]